ncbi:MAG: ATPase domain-containing protein [Alphaproteobacteria bacterium]
MTVPRTKLGTGVPGFDAIARGGLPRGRFALLSGGRGTGKTTFALQFLAAGIAAGDGGAVFVTFDETPDALGRSALDLGLDLELWRAEGRWAFVDAVPDPAHETVFAGDFDLGGLLARIEAAVAASRAARVVLDSIDGLMVQVPRREVVQHELRRLAQALASMGVTTVATTTGAITAGDTAAVAPVQAIADTVVRIERHAGPDDWPLTIEIVAMRGAAHLAGAYPVAVVPGEGLGVLAPPAFETEAQPPDRAPTGNPGLDRMLGGGIFADTLILLQGPPGSGKSLLAMEFLAGGAGSGAKGVLVSFSESRSRIVADAAGWAIDIERMEADRRLAIVCARPDVASFADHLFLIDTVLDRFAPRRLVVEGLAAHARLIGPRVFVRGVAHLAASLRQRGIAGLLTWPTALDGTMSPLDRDLATFADAIVALDVGGDRDDPVRTIAVAKMRGSRHDQAARAYTIVGDGFHIGRSWREADALATALADQPEHVGAGDEG